MNSVLRKICGIVSTLAAVSLLAACETVPERKEAAPAPEARPAPTTTAQSAPRAKPKAKTKAKAKKKKKKKVKMLNITEKIELQSIPFNKAEMTDDNKKDLDKFLAGLRKANKRRGPVNFSAVVVTGHADRLGNLAYNMKLSERRAVVVKDYLVNEGRVEQKIIFWEGKGPKQPMPVTKFCDNKMGRKQLIECLSPNRRVTVEVVGRAVSRAKPKAKAKAKSKKKPKSKRR